MTEIEVTPEMIEAGRKAGFGPRLSGLIGTAELNGLADIYRAMRALEPPQRGVAPWSDLDLADLHASLDDGDTLEEAALFLCRDLEEVAVKARELELQTRKSPPPRRVTGSEGA